MELFKLIQTAEKPKIYEKGTAVMWTDEYVFAQLLQIHLSQETDLASRKEKHH